MYKWIRGMNFISNEIQTAEFQVDEKVIRFSVSESGASYFIPKEYEVHEDEIIIKSVRKLKAKQVNERVFQEIISNPNDLNDLYKIRSDSGDYYYRSMDNSLFIDDRIVKRKITTVKELLKIIHLFNKELYFIMDSLRILNIIESVNDEKVEYLLKNINSKESIRFAINEVSKLNSSSMRDSILRELKVIDERNSQF